MIHLIFYGEPVGKARARIFKDRAGNIRAVTPTKTRSWEESMKLQACQQMESEKMFDEPIEVHMQFFRSFPKSMSNKKRMNAKPTTKPDLDNYIKAVKDALRGIVWRDDSIIVRIEAEKLFSLKPCVNVLVSPYGGSRA